LVGISQDAIWSKHGQACEEHIAWYAKTSAGCTEDIQEALVWPATKRSGKEEDNGTEQDVETSVNPRR